MCASTSKSRRSAKRCSPPDFNKILKDHFKLILRSITLKEPLLFELSSIKCLNDQVAVISSATQESEDTRITKLLTCLLNVPQRNSNTIFEQFLTALRSNGQEHVANIFMPTENFEERPLSEEHYNLLVTKTDQLCRALDPSNCLLDKLVKKRVFDDNERRRVQQKTTNDLMAREIIEIMKRKSERGFESFEVALMDSRQEHVASILGVKTQPIPMKEDHCQLLTGALEELKRHVVQKDSALADELVKCGAFSLQDIKRANRTTGFDWIEFHDILLRKSDAEFVHIMSKLNSSGLLGFSIRKQVTKVEDERRRLPESSVPHDPGEQFSSYVGINKEKQKSRARKRDSVGAIQQTRPTSNLQGRSESTDNRTTAISETETASSAWTIPTYSPGKLLTSFTTAEFSSAESVASDESRDNEYDSGIISTGLAAWRDVNESTNSELIECFREPEDQCRFCKYVSKSYQVGYCEFKPHLAAVFLKHDAPRDSHTLDNMKQHIKLVLSRSQVITIEIWRLQGQYKFKRTVGPGRFIANVDMGTIGCFVENPIPGANAEPSSLYILTVGHINLKAPDDDRTDIIFAVMNRNESTELSFYGVIEKKWLSDSMDACLIKIIDIDRNNTHHNVVNYLEFTRIRLAADVQDPEQGDQVELFCNQSRTNSRKYRGTVLRTGRTVTDEYGGYTGCAHICCLPYGSGSHFTDDGESGMLLTTVPKSANSSVRGVAMIIGTAVDDCVYPPLCLSVAQPLSTILNTIRRDPNYSGLRIM